MYPTHLWGTGFLQDRLPQNLKELWWNSENQPASCMRLAFYERTKTFTVVFMWNLVKLDLRLLLWTLWIEYTPGRGVSGVRGSWHYDSSIKYTVCFYVKLWQIAMVVLDWLFHHHLSRRMIESTQHVWMDGWMDDYMDSGMGVDGWKWHAGWWAHSHTHTHTQMCFSWHFVHMTTSVLEIK